MLVNRRYLEYLKRTPSTWRRTLRDLQVVFYLCWALTAALLSGCGVGDREPERVALSGTVTYNGKPLSDGVIRFVPLPTCPAPTAGAPIVNGKYRLDGKKGAPVGTHKIQIEAFRTAQMSVRPGEPAPPMPDRPQQYLPQKYNSTTQLEITIQPGSPAITKDFDLTD